MLLHILVDLTLQMFSLTHLPAALKVLANLMHVALFYFKLNLL